jgi:hypothetical protein
MGANYNRGNMRQKWLVLPPIGSNCLCESYDDYYQLLKNLASPDDDVSESYDFCDMNNMGYCPSPDFNMNVQPKKDAYQAEGSFTAGTGVLPPIPPWSK